MRVLGIDPGKRGAIAVLDEKGAVTHLELLKSTNTLIDLLDLFANDNDSLVVGLEKAASRPGQSISAMFNYGAGWGELMGVLKYAKVPFTLIPPPAWCKNMHVGTDSKLKAKERSLQAAQRLFPNVDLTEGRGTKPHDGKFDALLIAEYLRRQHVKG